MPAICPNGHPVTKAQQVFCEVCGARLVDTASPSIKPLFADEVGGYGGTPGKYAASRNTHRLATAGIIIVAIAFIVIVGLLLAAIVSGGHGGANKLTVNPIGQSAGPSNSASSVPSSTTSASPSASAAPSTGAGFAVPAGGKVCASGAGPFDTVAAASTTSCPFATAVHDAYLGQGGNGSGATLQVTSPTTNKAYTMTCQAGSPVVCTGGNNAQVLLGSKG